LFLLLRSELVVLEVHVVGEKERFSGVLVEG
jgi:hypothetical protein